MPSCTLTQYRDQNNLLTESAVPIPPIVMDFLVQNPFVSARPLAKSFPLPDEVDASFRHAFNTTYPGANYQCLVQATGGSPPYKYELLSGPGTIGEFLDESVSGDLTPGRNYSVITAPNIAGGAFNVVVRAIDQSGDSVIWQWILRSELDLNFFAATANVGSGSGADEANAQSLSTVYIDEGVVSPARGKVLRLLPGEYSAALPEMRLSPQYHPMSVAAITDAAVILHNRFNAYWDDIYVEGITFKDIDVPGESAVVRFSGLSHRHTVWRCTLDGIYNTVGGSQNQACFSCELLNQGGLARENINIVDCVFKNCVDVHAYDFYSVESHLFERNTFVYDDPAITVLSRSLIFPKSTCYKQQIAYNKCNNDLDSNASGLVQLYNAHAVNAHARYQCDFFYNTFRSVGGSAGTERYLLTSNGASNGLFANIGAIEITTRIERNSLQGPIMSRNYNRDFGVNRESFYASNAVQSPDGGIPVPNPLDNDPVWFTKTGAECEGTSGIFDSELKLTGASEAFAGTRGAQLRRVA